MYYNGHKYRIDTFLNEVHKNMIDRYNVQSEFNEYKNKAQILQEFLQDLKGYANDPNYQIKYFNAEILESVLGRIKESNSRINLNALFQHPGRKGGFQFENELARVFSAVALEVTGKKISYTKFKSGQAMAGIDLENILNEETLQEIYSNLQTQLRQQGIVDENDLGELIKKYYFVSGDRQGKIDNRGLAISFDFIPNNKLHEVFNIINSATFSLKNYSSFKFNKTTMQYDLPNNNPLTLGSTQFEKAIAGGLQSLGYNNYSTIVSATMAMQNSKSSTVQAHANHLRFLYELTGEGLVYNRGLGKLGPVEYLIYNDPTGSGIYVKSSYELIQKVINEGLGISSGKKIVISRDVVSQD